MDFGALFTNLFVRMLGPQDKLNMLYNVMTSLPITNHYIIKIPNIKANRKVWAPTRGESLVKTLVTMQP